MPNSLYLFQWSIILKTSLFAGFRQYYIALPVFLLSLYCSIHFQSVALAQDTFPDSTVLAPGDTVRLTLKEHSFLNSLAGNYTVNPEGSISIKGVGSVQMAGGTVSTRKEEIRIALQEIISIEPKAKLSLIKQNRFVLMAHGVRYPGWYKVPLNQSIEDLTDVASGAIPGAALSTAKISRVISGETQDIPFEEALPLQSFDHLTLDINLSSEIVDNGDLLYVVVPRETTPAENAPREMIFFMDEVQVDRYGYIFLSSQGSIKVAGHTTKQISKILTDNLPVYLKTNDKAEVNLIAKKHYTQVLGQIAQPGWYNVHESANIQAVIHQAGGILPGGDLGNVIISRKKDGHTERLTADVHYYFLMGDDRMLPVLQENDTIFIPLAPVVDMPEEVAPVEIASIRVLGAVNSPGMYPAPMGMNLLDLLLTAGGGMPEADLSRIQIMRPNKKKEIFNLQSMLNNDTSSQASAPPVLHGDDIVFVPMQEGAAAQSLSPSEMIRILGAVNTPGMYPAPTGMNLLDLLLTAGGGVPEAGLSKIQIMRPNKKKELFDLQGMLDSSTSSLASTLPVLHGNDIVFVPMQGGTATQPPAPSEMIRIYGAVNSPVSYPAPQNGLDLLDILIAAGGESADADLEKISIMHADGKKETFDMNALLDTDKQSAALPKIYGGDIVHVGRRLVVPAGELDPDNPFVTIIGLGSQGQGTQPFVPPMSPIQAIAQAGGMNEFADTDDIIIMRRVNGEQKNLPYDYDKALKGKKPDVDFQLQNRDIIYIP
ncbi:SLBB domain-containing protein [Desulfobulbus sp. US4]|nr:SLBB domain-containing protein [Desulfobulbus sp. US4]